MTPAERSFPHLIDGRRRQRIARGSGTTVEQVNQLLEGRKMMERMLKNLGKGKLPSLPGAPASARGATKRKKSKRKAGRR